MTLAEVSARFRGPLDRCPEAGAANLKASPVRPCSPRPGAPSIALRTREQPFRTGPEPETTPAAPEPPHGRSQTPLPGPVPVQSRSSPGSSVLTPPDETYSLNQLRPTESSGHVRARAAAARQKFGSEHFLRRKMKMKKRFGAVAGEERPKPARSKSMQNTEDASPEGEGRAGLGRAQSTLGNVGRARARRRAHGAVTSAPSQVNQYSN